MKETRSRTTARIFAILARDAATAVIIRRGPSRLVQLIKWNTETDEFEHGQWFKGRIHERRCDLSPSGKLFLYFATKDKGALPKWTAISKPPYLTALALWRAGASTGGGLFDSETVIMLNQSLFSCGLQPGFTIAPGMTVYPANIFAELYEDDLYERRLLRDGWKQAQANKIGGVDTSEPERNVFGMPRFYSKPFKYADHAYLLSLTLRHDVKPGGPYFVSEYKVTDNKGSLICSLGSVDWADCDHSGNLLFADAGKIFRLRSKSNELLFSATQFAVELIDLNDSVFEPVPPPSWATTW